MSDSASELDNGAGSAVPSVHVGQFSRLLEQAGVVTMERKTDEDYTDNVIAEGKRSQDTYETFALLKKSCESFGNFEARRMGSFCEFLMAVEFFSLGDFSKAKNLFDGVASQYRQEGWVTLLWEVLGYLRECSRKQVNVKHFVEYSLEMAALPVSSGIDTKPLTFKECGPAGPPTLSQREIVQKEVFGLVSREVGLVSVEDNNEIRISGDNPLHLEVDLVSPLRVVLLASVAFHEQIIKPGVSTLFTVSLLSQLPLSVEIDQLEIQFNQSECNMVIVNAQRPSMTAMNDDQQVHCGEITSSLTLVANKWLRLMYEIKSDQSGKLECISVIAKMGPHFTICCRAESPASMEDLPLWKFEDRVQTLPTKDPALAFYGQKATHIEEPDPQVDVDLDASGPALVGESFLIPVTVASRGHDIYSGELKINLVDVKGGGLFSPRETETSSVDNHHVELLGVVGPQGKELGDEIEKIQHSFGLVSVPFLKNRESWSCKLEIKWHRPKPVMLYVSLAYSSSSNDTTTPKVHVHKSLQIEGLDAVAIDHRFMLPFRRDPLLHSRIKPVTDSEQLAPLPLNETSLLIISAKNCTKFPLQLQSMVIDHEDEDSERLCSVQNRGTNHVGSSLLMPGEEFKKVFTIFTDVYSSKLRLGSVSLRWRRDSGKDNHSGSFRTDAWVVAKHKLPDVEMELSPLAVSLDCPPYAVLGEPFTYMVRIRNHTKLLQEVKISVADAQSFVLSGLHNDTVFALPKSERILSYRVVPLASGWLQLPKVTVNSVRYSAEFQSSDIASTVFVFPSKPKFKMAVVGERKMEYIGSE